MRLISTRKLANDGMHTLTGPSSCLVTDSDGCVVVHGSRQPDSLYYVSGVSCQLPLTNIARAVPNLQTWHRRLGHVNYKSIIDMAKNGVVTGMPIDLSTLPPLCEHCVLGKQMKMPVLKVRGGERAKKRLEKVFSDITGPEDVGSLSGEKYILNFIDDFSGMSWIYPLKQKSNAADVLKAWKTLVENESGEKVKIFRTDNGGEYTSGVFETYLIQEGVRHQTTAPYTSAENGKAERCHRMVMNRARAIRSDSKLPPSLWAESVRAAAYIKNRTPTRTLKDKMPYEMWHGTKPDLSHLRELGC